MNAIGWLETYVKGMPRAKLFYEAAADDDPGTAARSTRQ
jgi:hypothetical protein